MKGGSKIRYDMTGERYGRLTVESIFRHKQGNKELLWHCKCDCGNYTNVSRDKLIKGTTKSCGCLQRELAKKNATTHGLTKTRLYTSWHQMKARCYYEKSINYSDYGGRGIKVCEEWKNSFLAFREWALANGYTDNLTLDRIDVNGNYEPSNCRWATRKEQDRNKRNNIFITMDGETKSLPEWCEIKGVPYARTQKRYRKGYPLDIVFKKENLINV